MASSSSKLLFSALISISLMAFSEGNFYQDTDIVFGDTRAKILEGGQILTLSLDKASGSGFKSKKEYLFGRFDIQIKLIPGNSAGTVTTFYLSSLGEKHDEIDMEFLGNTSGNPYVLHTNVYTRGKGNREQGFYLWFDPTQDFHTYSIVWNPQHIIFLVDNRPIRVFDNLEKLGVAYANKQAMRAYATIWDADDWATSGGKVKTDWSKAPFTASYRNFNVNTTAWQNEGLNTTGWSYVKLAQKKYMTYDYCLENNNTPIECRTDAHKEEKIKSA